MQLEGEGKRKWRNSVRCWLFLPNWKLNRWCFHMFFGIFIFVSKLVITTCFPWLHWTDKIRMSTLRGVLFFYKKGSMLCQGGVERRKWRGNIFLVLIALQTYLFFLIGHQTVRCRDAWLFWKEYKQLQQTRPQWSVWSIVPCAAGVVSAFCNVTKFCRCLPVKQKGSYVLPLFWVLWLIYRSASLGIWKNLLVDLKPPLSSV